MELNAGGAATNVISWDDWWNIKEQTNQRLFQAIGDQDINLVLALLDENPASEGMMADVNARDERN